MWPTIAALAYLSKAGYDIYSGLKEKKESTGRLKTLTGGYMRKSPEERQFLAMLQRRIEKGALPVRAMTSAVSSDIGEQGQVARQKALGFAASRGLENTGVAASMAGKVGVDTMRVIARQARAIAIQNEMTKVSAQRELGQYGMGQSDLMRQAAMLRYRGGENISDTAYRRISEGIGGFGKAAGTYAMGQQGDPSEMIMNFLGGAEDQEEFDYRLSLLRTLYPNMFKSGGGAKEMPINPFSSII